MIIRKQCENLLFHDWKDEDLAYLQDSEEIYNRMLQTESFVSDFTFNYIFSQEKDFKLIQKYFNKFAGKSLL